jgi:hypothetical protein
VKQKKPRTLITSKALVDPFECDEIESGRPQLLENLTKPDGIDLKLRPNDQKDSGGKLFRMYPQLFKKVKENKKKDIEIKVENKIQSSPQSFAFLSLARAEEEKTQNSKKQTKPSSWGKKHSYLKTIFRMYRWMKMERNIDLSEIGHQLIRMAKETKELKTKNLPSWQYPKFIIRCRTTLLMYRARDLKPIFDAFRNLKEARKQKKMDYLKLIGSQDTSNGKNEENENSKEHRTWACQLFGVKYRTAEVCRNYYRPKCLDETEEEEEINQEEEMERKQQKLITDEKKRIKNQKVRNRKTRIKMESKIKFQIAEVNNTEVSTKNNNILTLHQTITTTTKTQTEIKKSSLNPEAVTWKPKKLLNPEARHWYPSTFWQKLEENRLKQLKMRIDEENKNVQLEIRRKNDERRKIIEQDSKQERTTKKSFIKKKQQELLIKQHKRFWAASLLEIRSHQPNLKNEARNEKSIRNRMSNRERQFRRNSLQGKTGLESWKAVVLKISNSKTKTTQKMKKNFKLKKTKWRPNENKWRQKVKLNKNKNMIIMNEEQVKWKGTGYKQYEVFWKREGVG